MPERRFLYNFRSLPETFGRIEVMELWLLLAYPSAVPEKAVAGLNLAAAFYLLGRDLALFGTFLCNSNEPMTKVSNAKSMRTRPSAAQSLSDTANHLLPFLASHETTLDEAKRIADDTVEKSGHVCNGNCKGWEIA